MATLRLVPASGSPIEIDAEKAQVVGRDKGCDVVIDDVSVSRKHARLERWGSNWAVVDQRSANGTFLDGQRVTETVLRSGQELRFGGMAYRVEIEEFSGGATVLMSMPIASAATVMAPAPVPPRPVAPPRPPAPSAPPSPTPPAPPAPVVRPAPPGAVHAPAPEPHPSTPPVPQPAPPPRRPAPMPHVDYPPEPVAKGKGPVFWIALGCGGALLLGLVGLGILVGGGFYRSQGAVEAVRAQLKDIKEGNLGAAYARTAASYQAAHTLAAFAAFVDRHPGLKGNTDSTFSNRSVENDTASLTGTLAHGAGTEGVAYKLVKDSGTWKISSIEVDGDAGAAGGAGAGEGAGLTVEIVALNKAPQGQAVAVKFDVRVTGFDLRPEGNLFRVDLAEDLETFGPDGKRMDELSRVGLQTFNQTTTSATDATATFKTSMTFARPEPGKYRAIITIRDTVGQKSKQQEVAFDLP